MFPSDRQRIPTMTHDYPVNRFYLEKEGITAMLSMHMSPAIPLFLQRHHLPNQYVNLQCLEIYCCNTTLEYIQKISSLDMNNNNLDAAHQI